MIIKETTGTVGGFSYPPHTYELNSAGKLVAFTPENGKRVIFAKPMMFDKKGRKFKKLS